MYFFLAEIFNNNNKKLIAIIMIIICYLMGQNKSRLQFTPAIKKNCWQRDIKSIKLTHIYESLILCENVWKNFNDLESPLYSRTIAVAAYEDFV
jgi:hypothetical protein